MENHKKTKHINIWFYVLKHKRRGGIQETKKISEKDQPANIFTKGVPMYEPQTQRKAISVVNIEFNWVLKRWIPSLALNVMITYLQYK